MATMEQENHWEAAVLAAGITTVYNADDWERIAETRANAGFDASARQDAAPQY